MNVLARLLLGVSMAAAVPLHCAEPALIVCGAEEVFILPARERVTKKDVTWSWRAEDSPEIPANLRGSFASTDECKSYGENLLVTSSSGGIALVRRADKNCLFFATSKNAHSACLLPGNLVAVASSFGGDELCLFDLAEPGKDPVEKLDLYGAHGVVWDAGRRRIWALGTENLLLLKLEKRALAIEATYKLPTSGGHDLSWTGDDGLFISVDEKCYRFDCAKREFSPFEPLANEVSVKSIDLVRGAKRIVWHRGTEETWWSDTIRFLEPEGTITLPDERLYKVRWDQPRMVPE